MYIKKEFSFAELFDNSWSGALNTLKTVSENEKEEELMEYLECIFSESVPTETEVNDYLWFDSENIFYELGIEVEA